MALDQITTGIIKDDAVTAAKIVAGAVVADIANDSIDSQHYVAASIDNEHLADDAVGTAELANDVVINTSGAITTTGAFTSPGIDDNANANAITIDVNEKIGLGTAPSNATLTIKSHHATDRDSGLHIISSTSHNWYVQANSTDASLRINYNDSLDAVVADSNGDVTVSTGDLKIGTAGKGISFAVTANSIGSPGVGSEGEVLDDYEEGTWTPMDTDSGGSSQMGMYTKVGNLVTASFHFATGSISGSDTFYLRGFPFTCGSTDYFRGPISIAYTNASYFIHQGYVSNNATHGYLMQGSGSIATDNHVGQGKTISGSITYRVPG